VPCVFMGFILLTVFVYAAYDLTPLEELLGRPFLDSVERLLSS